MKETPEACEAAGVVMLSRVRYSQILKAVNDGSDLFLLVRGVIGLLLLVICVVFLYDG